MMMLAASAGLTCRALRVWILELVRDFLGHETLSTTLLCVKMLGISLRKNYRDPLEDVL